MAAVIVGCRMGALSIRTWLYNTRTDLRLSVVGWARCQYVHGGVIVGCRMGALSIRTWLYNTRTDLRLSVVGWARCQYVHGSIILELISHCRL